MIDQEELSKKTVAPTEKKQEATKSTPIYAQDSQEVEFIRQKIKQNREYLAKCTSAAAYKKVEKDTLFLENNILPILLTKTNLFYNDTVKLFVLAFDKAVNNGCNALLHYAQIRDDYETRPKLAMFNQRKEFDKLGVKITTFAVIQGENSDNFDYPYFDVNKH